MECALVRVFRVHNASVRPVLCICSVNCDESSNKNWVQPLQSAFNCSQLKKKKKNGLKIGINSFLSVFSFYSSEYNILLMESLFIDRFELCAICVPHFTFTLYQLSQIVIAWIEHIHFFSSSFFYRKWENYKIWMCLFNRLSSFDMIFLFIYFGWAPRLIAAAIFRSIKIIIYPLHAYWAQTVFDESNILAPRGK